MGKFKSCSIGFRDKKEVYREGEIIGGYVILEVLEPLTVKGVRVYCCGEALTKWSREFSRDWNTDNIGSEKYFNQVYTVFGKKPNADGPNVELKAGTHRWAFAFRLPPTSLPSSYEGEHGAVRWWLRVEVDKPFPSINNKWYRPITVLSKLDLNERVYAVPQSKTGHKIVSKALGLGNAGNVSLTATTDRFGYCPGERVIMNIVAENTSTKDMGRIEVCLVQRVQFVANDDTKIINLGIATMQTEVNLSKGETLTMNDVQLPIPAVPPSTRKRTCHIITVTYYIKVTVQVPWGINLDVQIPIAIGTIPRGKRVPPLTPPGQQAPPPDPRTAITYRRCEVGITPCRKWNNNFPNFPCTPMTPYVENYVYIPATAPAAAAASPSATAQQSRTQVVGLLTKPGVGMTVSPPGPQAPPPGAQAPFLMPSAPPMDELVAPPSYEEVLRMDEESRTQSAGQQQSQTARPKPEPKGRACALLVIRFPDRFIADFRETIQREQNNLMDTEQAFVASLCPQPLTGLTVPNDEWPGRTAVAVVVFPTKESAGEWITGAGERGEKWYTECDAAVLPAKWNVPQEARPMFTLSFVRARETATRQQILNMSKNNSPKVALVRQEHGGVRLVASKDVTMVTGKWLSDQTVVVTYWPHIDKYFAYRECLRKEYPGYKEEFQAIYDSSSLLLVSEDVKLLSTLSAIATSSDINEGEGQEGDDDDTGDETKAEETSETDDMTTTMTSESDVTEVASATADEKSESPKSAS